MLGRAPEDPAWLFRRFDRPDLPLAQRLLYLDLHTYLPDNNLMLVDRSTMAHGLEARVPSGGRRGGAAGWRGGRLSNASGARRGHE